MILALHVVLPRDLFLNFSQAIVKGLAIGFVHQIKFNLNQEKLKHSKKKKLGGSSNKSCVPATTVKKARYESEDPDEVVDQARAMAMIC